MTPLTWISPCCLPDLDVPKHSTGAGGTWHQNLPRPPLAATSRVPHNARAPPHSSARRRKVSSPTSTHPEHVGLPEPRQGYSQLRADLGGPDAVEGVFQLHSPAKRENTELPRRPRGWQRAPCCFPLWARRTRGGPRCAAVKCPKASASSLGALSLLMRQGIQPQGSKPSFPKAP